MDMQSEAFRKVERKVNLAYRISCGIVGYLIFSFILGMFMAPVMFN